MVMGQIFKPICSRVIRRRCKKNHPKPSFEIAPSEILHPRADTEMVVRLRLSRLGCKNRPFYRLMAADSRSPRDGKHLEILGYYNPIPGKP